MISRPEIRRDCRYFTGETPCRFHKQYGAECRGCDRYSPAGKKILIIKLGAKGDVIRTTPLLRGLKEKHPGCSITWVTEEGSGELLRNIDILDNVLELSPWTAAYLSAVEFDIVLSLDPAAAGAGIAENVRSGLKKGFGLDSEGKLYPYDSDSEEWYLTGISDRLKRENTRTYQSFSAQASGIPGKNFEIIINLTDREKKSAEAFLGKNSIPEDKPLIGLNTGAGGRWEKKKWTRQGFLELIKMIKEDIQSPVLLFGGPMERERNRWLMNKSGDGVFDTGTDNPPRAFLSLLNLCEVVVSADTFAMHAAAGLGKSVVALFGPTSAAEIELYGRGIKIVSPAECVCCYRRECAKNPGCMELISPGTVFDAVKELTG